MSSGLVWTTPDNTRLVTIAAHVDAGKTTLADQLLEHNGIISERAAGTLRYLDSDPEEQRRGITMRSSAVGLRYQYHRTKAKQQQERTCIVHLVDSPGHTDFLREVSSSMVACDSALLLLDAVEGLTARTSQVFRETARNRLVPVLVINKVDRYWTDLHLEPTDAYLRLRSLLETVNGATGAMVASMVANTEKSETQHAELEKQWTFDPARGNVVFASAIHGWGFSVPGLARSLFRSQQLPVKPPIIRQYLFGDYCYKPETNKWIKWKQQNSANGVNVPVFAKFALQPIWDIYQGIESAAQVVGLGSLTTSTSSTARIQVNTPGMETVAAVLDHHDGIKLSEVLAKTGSNPNECLRAILRRYRSAAEALLNTVCEYCPSPAARPNLQLQHGTPAEISAAVTQCQVKNDDDNNNNSVPTVAHVCKFFLTARANVRDSQILENTSSGGRDNIVLGLARVLCGELVSGESYHVLGNDISSTLRIRVYLLMGSSFVNVPKVPAGHLCAIFGLESVQLPAFTIGSDPTCKPLQLFADTQHRPLVKVHVEAVHSNEVDVLERGLDQLRLVDGAVEVSTTDKGERLLACLGELHLAQTILDLQRTYCDREVELRISDPIVDFAETTVWFTDPQEGICPPEATARLRQTTISPYREEEGIRLAHHGRCRSLLPGRGAALQIRVLPLAPSVLQALTDKAASKESHDELLQIGRALGMEYTSDVEQVLQSLGRHIQCINEQHMSALVLGAGLDSGRFVRGVEGEDVFVNIVSESNEEQHEKFDRPGHSEYCELQERIARGWKQQETDRHEDPTGKDASAQVIWKNAIEGSLTAGFETGLRAGPVCEEPIRSILVVVESVEIALRKSKDGEYMASKPVAGGMVVSAMRSGIRCALLTRPVRLVEAYLRLTLHTPLTGLGSLYQVLNQRRGKVLEDTMLDGTDLLLITALVPQAEAFGLTPELLRKTSGEVAAPEMLFSHWERLDVDPFWVPTSDEEREDFGELQNVGDTSTGIDNTALSYIRLVRKRKGLPVDSARTVANAEKQRTLKR